MFKFLCIFGIFIASVYGNGEFTVLHRPSSLILKGHDQVKESILPEVYASALGFSTERYSNWQGLFIETPFNLCEAVVAIVVDGVSDIGQSKGHRFPLKTDEEDTDIFHSLERRVAERYPESSSYLVNVDLSNGLEEVERFNIFHGIKSDKPKKTNYNFLKLSSDEDREFLAEITLLNAIANKIEQGAVTKDNIPDVFWFKVSGLHALSDLYGENSTTVKEAKQLLNDAIIRINSAFNKAFQGSVLVTVITSDASHTRRTRSILAAEDDTTTDHNLAKNYSKDFPVFFNIILWFGVVMVFTLLAICLVIADMDPGRDSIIYRMTSTRMKKDN